MNGSLQIIKEIYYRMESKITAENFSEIWNNILIKSTDSYKIPAEVIHVSESTISTLGNFSASTGKGKSKKTFNVCAIVASALTGKKILKYEAHFPEGKQKVLYFDTEQSSFHCHKVLERINKLAGFPLDSNNDRIEFVMLREFNPIDRRQIIELALVNRPEVGLVIIDGLRDLLFDINSSTEAADVIGLLMRWTSQHNIHIHTVLHLNKGDDNVRGHIGTELNHKAETILQVTKDDNDRNISQVQATLIRDRDFLPFAFKINSEGLPELVEGHTIQKKPANKPFEFEMLGEEMHRTALDIAFEKDTEKLTYSPLLERMAIGYSEIGYTRCRNTQKKVLNFLIENGIINKQDRFYVYNRDFHYTPKVSY